MAREIKFIFVGKIKQNFWKKAEEFYLNRLKNLFSIKLITLKDVKENLPIKEKVKIESLNILKKISPQDFVILLDEKGTMVSSTSFAKKMTIWIESPGKIPCFIVGGPYGVSSELKKNSNFILSLSPLTFPHEMARIVLLEQVYRAHQISTNSPYHH